MSLKLVRLSSDPIPNLDRPVITIGAFDGLHRGHIKIVKRLVEKAREYGTKSVLISFHPHPRHILDPTSARIRLLTSLEEKINRLEPTGLDYLVIAPFTFDFAQLSAEEYVESFVIGKFNPRLIIVGEDHRFGKFGLGGSQVLKSYAKQGSFEYEEIKDEVYDNVRISSSAIRDYIAKNNIAASNRMLNYHYSFTGKVVKGLHLGNTIGYPTANLQVDDEEKLLPNPGVYAARMKFMDMYYDCMLYIGNRPTLGEQLNQTIELHIMDFNDNLYGEKIEVAVVDFIRNDIKFENLQALKDQIKKDALAIKRSLRRDGILYPELVSKQIAIAILNYNGKKYLKEFLPDILKNKPRNSTVYVIDNASKDDSVKFLEKTYPEVKIIRHRKNYGFASGYNKGLAQIKAGYYVLMNSDVKMNEDWISPIVDKMKDDPYIFAAQGKIMSLERPDEFEYAGAAGGLIDWLGYPFCKGRIINHIEHDYGQYNEEEEIFWCSGAAMVINARVFDELRGFDDNYFAHQEEIDLCWRMRRIGGKIMYFPFPKVFHLGGGTLNYENPKKVYLNFRNNLFTLFKNTPWWALPPILASRLLLDVFVALSYLLKGKLIHAYKIIQAYVIAIINTLYLVQKKTYVDQQLDELRIGVPRKSGVLKGFILLQYYLFNNTTVTKIPSNYFSKN